MYKNITKYALPSLLRFQQNENLWGISKRLVMKASSSPNMNVEDISDVTENAFKSVKSSDILKSLIIFNLCSIKPLVNNADKIIAYSKSIIGETIPSQLIKNTFYHQFCSGELSKTAEFLKLNNVSIMVDIATDYIKDLNNAEFHINHNYKGNLECIDKTAEYGIEGVKFKPVKLAGICKYSVLEALAKSIRNNDPNLTKDTLDDLKSLEEKISEIVQYAISKNVKILIDAEDFKLQPAIDLLALRAAEKFNNKQVNVFNTYQLYLKDSYQKLKMDIEYFKFKKRPFGAKLVRGAYMVQERANALKYHYPCPIFDQKSETDFNFDKTIGEIIAEMKKRTTNIEVFIGSHNRSSIEKLISKMTPLISENVYFGQLYGMADYLSFMLGRMNYKVVKLVPYGPVDQVIPYLIRRAQENSDALGSVKNDISVLKLILYKRLKQIL